MDDAQADDLEEKESVAAAAEAPPEKPENRTLEKTEAIYKLESPVRCPQCGESMSTLKAVRLLRTEVNFTSTLPRRGRVTVCPHCQSVVPAELTNF